MKLKLMFCGHKIVYVVDINIKIVFFSYRKVGQYIAFYESTTVCSLPVYAHIYFSFKLIYMEACFRHLNTNLKR